ncbi:phage holin family protein [Tepidibacillus marianensis]|uniref:phage holin family protein n=1 Tax=Tepidibacillus marianensis TaxID=3131995 RepID=UPI0030CDF92E
MRFLVRLILNGFALLVADRLVEGIHIQGVTAAIIAALILGVVNTIIRPILILFTFPITILSLGLFVLIINAITFSFTAAIVNGFTVDSFGAAFWGAIITSIFSWILNSFADDKGKHR